MDAALALLVGLVLACGAVLWWSADTGITGVERTRSVDARAAQAAQDIRYLDEVLTHSAARYAATGDSRWERRYEEAVGRLDAAIATSRQVGGAAATRPLDAVDDANQRLIARETEALRLAGQGRLVEAQERLTGEYDGYKAEYTAGLEEFVAQQQAAARSSLDAQRRTLVANRSVAVALVVVLVLSVSALWWVYRVQAGRLGEQSRRLVEHATTDVLTGLPNRRAAMTMLGALTAAVRTGAPGAAIFIDLDGFKSVNDTFGHGAGDLVLAEAARRLTTEVQTAVGGDGRVTRLGGDEFFIVLQRDLHTAHRLAHSCLVRLQEPFPVGAASSRLSASIGVVDVGSRDADDVLQDADFAAAHAKDHGKSQVQVFDAGMRQRMIDRHHLERDLRAALDRGDLEVHYQPIVAVDQPPGGPPRHQVVAAEALVRWRLLDGSLVPPADFVPIAEGSWLIVEIDRLVLDTACAQAAAWAAEGLTLSVSVNISGRHVLHGDLAADVRRALSTHGVEPSRVTVELTETAVLSDLDRAAAVLADVRALGVRVALDDFATGYSTLTHLTTLPADAIKIDRGYVAALSNAREHLMVEYLLRLAELSGLDVVAEGVETPQQLSALGALGCRTAQGFLFTPALHPEQFTDWARTFAHPTAHPSAPGPVAPVPEQRPPGTAGISSLRRPPGLPSIQGG